MIPHRVFLNLFAGTAPVGRRIAEMGYAVLEFDDGGFAYDVGVEVLTTEGDAITGPPLRPIRRQRGSIDVHLGSDWFGWFAR